MKPDSHGLPRDRTQNIHVLEQKIKHAWDNHVRTYIFKTQLFFLVAYGYQVLSAHFIVYGGYNIVTCVFCPRPCVVLRG